MRDNPEKKTIRVLVSMTLSKSFDIEVDTYDEQVERDEDGIYTIVDYDNCDLKQEVQDQIILPNDWKNYIDPKYKEVKEMASNWDIDDFEVVID